MEKNKAILLSIKPRYAYSILSGTKKVELRRSFPILNKGDCVVIYASSPKRAVIGYFIVDYTDAKESGLLWEDVSSLAGLTKDEFFNYFQNCTIGHAIYFQKVASFSVEISYQNLPC
ncbi:MAG: hypothetical protein Q8S22_00815, partial [Eubacteriales bacterium]|nr:hypothetical protein [Eubacteriales bacterium]